MRKLHQPKLTIKSNLKNHNTPNKQNNTLKQINNYSKHQPPTK